MDNQMKCPDLKGVSTEIIDYIRHLEEKAAPLRNNGAVDFMVSLNEQLSKLAEQIRAASIDFTNSDDKLYERFLNTAKLGKDLTADFKWLIQEYGEKIEEDTSKKTPLIERRAQQK